MIHCDLNCDMGEGIGNDEQIMPFITSANIACGYHAGDEQTMRATLQCAIKHNVAVGAHPGYPDKENFGRTDLPATPGQVYQWVTSQLSTLAAIARSLGSTLRHVKPHGALYNRAAKDALIAKAIVDAVKDADPSLVFFGLSGSVMISEAKAAGLTTASEVFADRTYQDDGSLTPRTHPNALIENDETAIRQVMQMLREGTVTSVGNKQVPIVAETICLHGDGSHARSFAQLIHHTLQQQHIVLAPR
jgi:5-oxoprolinase (ATP-hydrolysing) subunit A